MSNITCLVIKTQYFVVQKSCVITQDKHTACGSRSFYAKLLEYLNNGHQVGLFRGRSVFVDCCRQRASARQVSVISSAVTHEIPITHAHDVNFTINNARHVTTIITGTCISQCLRPEQLQPDYNHKTHVSYKT